MARVPNVVLKERAFRPLVRAVRRVAIGATRCPWCGSNDVRRSIRRTFRDFSFACLFLAPFRCRKCRARFFRVWRPDFKKPAEPPRAPVLVMPRQVFEIDPVQPYPVEIVEEIEPPPILVPPVRLIRPRSILILESDLSIRKLLRRLLDRRGYFTCEINQPEDLATELRERRVDLLIVDASHLINASLLSDASPLRTAFGLADVHPHLKILALSLESPNPAEIPARCLALTKPFSLESFLESVDHLLEPAAG